MNVSRRWLESFLRRPLEARDVAQRLAMLGAPVDAIEPLHAGLEAIRVALVEDVRPHPNADRLRVCTVNDGSPARLNVVCGAANVTAGRRYPFAPVGATIPGRPPRKPALTLERRKIRGEVSEGMLCSLEELGFEPEGDGIWELETDAAPGTPLLEALSLGDDRLIVDVTPNRPDLLGHKGIARELAASYDVPFRLPVIPGAVDVDVPPSVRAAESGAGTSALTGGVRVGIEDAEGCARFHGVVIRDVRIARSPEWLIRRLEAAGVRAINNVVDATNYVMLEFAQPMHAYDVARLHGPAVIARRGRKGERVTTLDGVERTVTPEMTVIADEAGAIGIGGVMGGAGTEVHDGTTDVFLECAWFEPSRLRKTRTALGLSTDASYRFERGVDLWNAGEPFRRCIELVLTLAGGTLAEAPVDLWPRVTHPPRIFLRLPRLAQVLGVELPLHTIERHLVAIGATVVAKPEDQRIAVDVPGWRPDLTEEIDLIEEVARRHGYDEFPVELRRFRVGTAPDAPLVEAAERVRRRLVAEGLLEAMTLPMVPAGDVGIRLLNPVSAEHSMLRHRLLPGLARQVELNWARRERDVRLFEIGAVFAPGGDGALPAESQRVAAVVSGAREPGHWTGAAPDADLWDLKGLFESAVAVASPGATIEPDGAGWVARNREGRAVGSAGPVEADSPPWAAPVFGLELELELGPRPARRFVPRPATPASERDVTLLVPDGVAAETIARVLSGGGVTVLESVRIVNAYRGGNVPAGARSVTFRLTFRAADRTLEASEIDSAEAHLLLLLERETGVRRRDQGEAREE
ncbi:MAG TPA: phenylalanine--tRNA ligase subunit beta [Gemmatimonadales bacterium]|nr:phenylalanine--tRNA ligase subunit beta [Gemmatimonadales bacterium]